MTEPTGIDSALQRLAHAIDSLEAAAHRNVESDKSMLSLQEDMQKMDEDRSRLAQDLDRTAAQRERLQEVNKEVSRRLVSAMESIRGVLDSHGG